MKELQWALEGRTGATPDRDVLERWRSYTYRRLMRVTVAEYEATPALTVDWDLELRAVEQRVQETLAKRNT